MAKKKASITVQVTSQFENEEYILNLNSLQSIGDFVNESTEVKLLQWIAKSMKEENVILLSMKVRQKIMSELKISRTTITKSIKLLQENKILFKDPELSCTTFRVKPYVIFKKSNKENL